MLFRSGKDTSISLEMREVVDFLRSHRQIWWLLHNAYMKIVKNNVVGTCPLVCSKPHGIWPFGSKYNFHEFHRMFHESIHYVLEQNGLCFNDGDLDEGLVAYFHEQILGQKECRRHYKINGGERCLKNAALFAKIFDRYPRSAVIPVLKSLKKEDLLIAR